MNKVILNYILKNFLKRFLIVVLVFYCFGMILNLFEEIEFFKNLNVSIFKPLILTSILIPGMLIKILPFIIFISSMWFMLSIRNNKDLLTLKVFGYSNIKIFFILALTSFILGWAILILINPITSSMSKYYEKTKSNYSRDIDHLVTFNKNGLWIKEYFDDTHRVISANKPQGLNLLDVTIFHLDENSNLNFKYIKELNPNNKLKIIANFLNSPDALDAGGLNLEEVQSDRSQARSRNVQYDAREKVKQYKIGLNLSSIIRKLELTNSIYYNKRLFDGKLPFSYGGIVDLERIFWGYNLNANIKAGLNYDFGLSYNNQSDDRQRFMNDSGLKKDQVMGQNENYNNISLYFFGSKSIKKLNFSTGARLENNSISLDNYFGSSDEKIKKINSFNPSLNISYEFDKIDFFTNFSTGYETPTLNELSATSSQSGFNDDLNSIKSTTFEFGVANFDKESNNNNLNIIFNLKSVGKIYADNANNTEIAGYNSIGFKMSKDLTLFQQNVTPFISIENLLNEDYFDNIRINAFGSRFYEPASGINFVCGLKLQL